MGGRLRLLLFAGLGGLALVVVACGGRASAVPPVQTGTSSSGATAVAVAGTVGGTSGALTFNQAPLLTGSAQVTAQGKPSTPAKIQPGSVIRGTATRTAQGYDLQSADVHHELEGTIDSVDVAASKLVVVGQTVKVDALTVIEEEGPGDTLTSLTLAGLKAGDRVEVYGSPTATGEVLASRIEREPAGMHSEDAFHGVVAALDATAKTFQAGGYTVAYGGAAVHGTLANGAKVEVHGTLSGMIVTATLVVVETGREDVSEPELEVCGTLSGLDATAKTFQLMAFKVDYATAKVEGTLAEGARVEVEGSLSAGTPVILVATKVEVTFPRSGSGASDREREGLVTAINPTDKTLTLGSDTFWTDANTLFVRRDAPASFSDVAVGTRVELALLSTRLNAAGQVYAAKVRLQGP